METTICARNQRKHRQITSDAQDHFLQNFVGFYFAKI